MSILYYWHQISECYRYAQNKELKKRLRSICVLLTILKNKNVRSKNKKDEDMTVKKTCSLTSDTHS